MKLFQKNELCCGCEACKEICPCNAITMKMDQEGFYYPSVNSALCSLCGLCIKVCPMKGQGKSNSIPELRGVKNKQYDRRMKETSGGFFSILCEYVLVRHGSIYSVKYEKDNKSAVYSRVCTADYEGFFESKYVQSLKKGIYKKILHDIQEKKKVLFVGTPCDCAGLKAYLEIKKVSMEDVILCDIVCGGVPSPLIFQRYIEFLENMFDSKMLKFHFRDKSINGWSRYGIRADFPDARSFSVPNLKDYYFTLFDNFYISRPSCYQCRWATANRETDFTLGDFWGIETIDLDFYDNAGVSLVLLNTDKAKYVFHAVSDRTLNKAYDLSSAVQFNPCLEKSIYLPVDRKEKLQIIENDMWEAVRMDWLPWKMTERVIEQYKNIKTVAEISVNSDWIPFAIKKVWGDIDIINIQVNKDNEESEIKKKELLEGKRIDLLRMELEGYEFFYLSKILQDVLKSTPIILIELMRKWAAQYDFAPNDVFLLLKKYGYKCLAINEKMEFNAIEAITNKMSERWYLFYV